MALKNDSKNVTPADKAGFPLPGSSYKMILIGCGIILLGFLLMMGGGSDNPNEFSYDIFSFRRITLAPIVVLGGFGFVFWAIMRKPKENSEKEV